MAKSMNEKSIEQKNISDMKVENKGTDSKKTDANDTKILFFRYVSLSIFGMLGVSLYLLADTYFISLAEGTNGIAGLNLVMPFYNLIFGIGNMCGIGGAIRYSIEKEKKNGQEKVYFTNSLMWVTILSIPFILIGAFFLEETIAFLGGDAEIIQVTSDYARIFLCMAPCFMWNMVINAFVRNDGAPSIAMAGTIISSAFNVVADYVLMFPLHMGMAGAALATSLAPLIGCLICSVHLFSKRNHLRFIPMIPSIRKWIDSCQVGFSAFIVEISTGITLLVYNYLLLKLVGNIGVAAYGVITNIALFTMCIFNGVSNGAQPLLSSYYGQGEKEKLHQVLRMGIIMAIVFAFIFLATIFGFTKGIINIFNRDQDPFFLSVASQGIRIYFIGFLFAGINIFGACSLSAVEKAKPAFIISMLRGLILILITTFALSYLFGVNGIWMSFAVTEGMTMIYTISQMKQRT